MIYAMGPISGCHINPAVTVNLLLTRKTDPKFASGYIATQIVGAILGCRCLLVIARDAPGGDDPSAQVSPPMVYGENRLLMPLAPISGSL